MARVLRAAAANAVEWGETRKESKSCKNNDCYFSQTPSMTSFLLGTLKGLFSRLQALIPTLRASSTSQPLDQVAGSLWNLGQLNHVAIAVPDLEKAAAFYKNILGAQVSEAVPLPEHGVSVVFVNLGNTKMELLHPLGCDSPIAGFLQKNKAGGMHHICIEVDNINAAVMDLKTKKIRSLSEEVKIGAHGKPVIFLHPKDCGGVLVELEQA
ncbi:methylmalonyl-CoA epimerase, mitochondrial isoform X1 [Trachypithecus francoisi]|uniref:methylmalonyl-CoA epimerase, mitochondrial isoform X1 n=1 Tax=Trachypithecus francoisi TaxID=54180 RepID=UPI00141B6D90|nr:methylmalonyl-CoA epimerase, mitochondrial isoform X1 [Trachypithecus francoisi]